MQQEYYNLWLQMGKPHNTEFMQLNIIETNTFDVITDPACIQTWFIASDDGVVNLSPFGRTGTG